MSLDTNPLDAFDRPALTQDDRTPLALVAGIIAAFVGGGIWAALVFATNLEIGWVAWGIGGLVGLAMSRATVNRSRGLAVAAAALAVLGLAAGKAFIFIGSSSAIAESITEDPTMLRGAIAWQMYDERALEPATLAAIDETETAGDTISDVLWADMLAQAEVRYSAMSEEEREQLAEQTTQGVMQSLGVSGGIMAQITLFDLLWVFLAVSTAFRMMSPAARQPAAEMASV